MKIHILKAGAAGGKGRGAVWVGAAPWCVLALVALLAALPGPVLADTRLVLSPSSVAGGTPSQGTITLAEPAPAAGMVVTLTSDNLVAALPAAVSVPAAATTASFTVTTQNVTSVTPVVITATYAGLAQAAALTVLPAALAALSLDPPTLPGGLYTQGTLTLTGPAPPGGAVVTFASDHPAFLRFPATVTIPAGAIAASFDITTRPVPAATLVKVAAVYAGAIRIAALTLAPVALSTFSLPTAAVPGGEAAIATVTLNAPAPPGGAVIALASDNPAVAVVPLSVTVAAGDDQITFPVDTAVVSAQAQAVITASYGGVAQSLTLTVSSLKLVFFRIGRDSVPGGTSVVGALMLSQVAPAGGIAVMLASDRPDVAVGPERILVLEGTAVTFFLVTTTPVKSATPVKLSATIGGVTQEVVLQVLPPGG